MTIPALLAPITGWPPRRWLVAALSSVLFALFVSIPTDLIDTSLFWREIPPTWWSWPSVAISSVLAGLLTATYVAAPAGTGPRHENGDKPGRGGYAAGLLTFFAVGCPVCNKLVLFALGSAGAITWFEPVQPLLQIGAIALLVWALHQRLSVESDCRLPDDSQRMQDV